MRSVGSIWSERVEIPKGHFKANEITWYASQPYTFLALFSFSKPATPLFLFAFNFFDSSLTLTPRSPYSFSSPLSHVFGFSLVSLGFFISFGFLFCIRYSVRGGSALSAFELEVIPTSFSSYCGSPYSSPAWLSLSSRCGCSNSPWRSPPV